MAKEYKFNSRDDLQRFRNQIRNQGLSRSKLRGYAQGVWVRGEQAVGFELDWRQLADFMAYLLGFQMFYIHFPVFDRIQVGPIRNGNTDIISS